MLKRQQVQVDYLFVEKGTSAVKTASTSINDAIVPKRQQRHYSYDESVNEPPKLIADEPTDVEGETPSEENQPIESVESDNAKDPTALEE